MRKSSLNRHSKLQRTSETVVDQAIDGNDEPSEADVQLDATTNVTTHLETLLSDHFGWKTFRPLQREIIETILAGESAFGILPTGGGKSLCYQMPALMLPGMTLVVSPLISLMKDQVDALTARGIAAIAVNSQDTPSEMQQKLAEIRAGRVRLVYVAPERLKNGAFLDACRRTQTSLLAVDEAHCVSQWGHDFRPDYRFIKDFRAAVGNPPLLALTATATRRVQDDVVAHLGIHDAKRFFGGVDRPNLWFGVERCETVAEKRGKVASLVERSPGSTIVYVSSRREADDLAELLETVLGEPVAAYHAGLNHDTRTAVQNRFMSGLVRVVTATNAFGMGIDKADVRAVIHAGVPESIEAYYQEVGRAGRDGEPAECTLVVVPGADVKTRQFLLEKDEPRLDQVQALIRRIAPIAQAGGGVVPLNDAGAGLETLVLTHLQAMGYLEIVQRTATGMQVHMSHTITNEVIDSVWDAVQQHVRDKKSRFRRMRNFVYLETCRREFLLQYFGEKRIEPVDACCSACEPRPATTRSIPEKACKRGARKPAAVIPESVNPSVFDSLRTWRREKAVERGVPAFVIFGDRDLAGIAAATPTTLDDLAACRGVGPVKLQMYGEEILAVIRSVMERAEVVRATEPASIDAANLFASNQTIAEVAVALERDEAEVWDAFLAWVMSSAGDAWKAQVRRIITPQRYVEIRAELRQRSSQPFSEVLKRLSQRYNYREIALTQAIMKRVGEI